MNRGKMDERWAIAETVDRLFRRNGRKVSNIGGTKAAGAEENGDGKAGE